MADLFDKEKVREMILGDLDRSSDVSFDQRDRLSIIIQRKLSRLESELEIEIYGAAEAINRNYKLDSVGKVYSEKK